MAVQVVGSLISSDRTHHQAVSVGQGRWTVSYLPGRTLDTKQAVAAVQVADALADMRPWTRLLGLTPLEAIGLAGIEAGPGQQDSAPPQRKGAVLSAGVVIVVAALAILFADAPLDMRGLASAALATLGASAALILIVAFLSAAGWPRHPIPRLSAVSRRPARATGSSAAWACSTRPGRLTITEMHRVLQVHRGHNCARARAAHAALQRRPR